MPKAIGKSIVTDQVDLGTVLKVLKKL